MKSINKKKDDNSPENDILSIEKMTPESGKELELYRIRLSSLSEDFNRAQAIAHIGSWRMNVVKNELVWSDEAYRIFEVPLGTGLNYELFLSFVHPEDREKVDLKWKEALRGEKYDIEHRILVNGITKWVSETAVLEFDESGRVLGGFGTVQDITQRKEVEIALRESQEKFAAAFISNPNGILLTNLDDGVILDANDSFLNIIGYTKDEIIGKSTLDINIYLNPGVREKILESFYANGFVRNFELRSKHKSGAERIVLISSELVTINNKKTLLSNIEDITTRKNLQEQLYNKNLSLERINEILKDFVYIAAHDLRSPVSSIIMMSELIQMQESIEEKELAFSHLVKLSKKLQFTVDGLLDLIRMETEQVTSTKKIDFQELFDQIMSDCSNELKRHDVNIVTEFRAPEICYVEAYLKSVLKNLITNAIKYSSDKPDPNVSVSTSRENNSILLEVKDNGIGIDLPAASEELFKPFKRLTSRSEGTGMGLYIVKNIVEKNGGHIAVESKPAIGTTFRCYLKEYPVKQ